MSNPNERSINKHQHKPMENNNLVAFAGPEQIVYEGSKVFLEGYSFPPNQKLVWKQIDGPKVELKYENPEDKNTKLNNPYFNSPFIALDFDKEVGITKYSNIKRNNIKPFIKLTFELTVKDPTETLSSKPSTVSIIVKMVQRALVFQGGG
jgi:hypothetical protein